MNNYSTYQIISAIDRLGIKREVHPNNKGWLPIICPNPEHNDKHFGNCSINVNNGVCCCFTCGYKKHIVSIIIDNIKCSYKEACQFIESGIGTVAPIKLNTVEKIKRKKKVSLYDFVSIPLEADNFYYTKKRKITKEFCETFNIQHALSKYTDYFIIPIIDTNKGINEYECRKLKEYEVLQKYMNSHLPYDELKLLFKEKCELEDIKINNKTYEVFIDGKISYDSNLKYLLQRKTYYIPESRCKETIWNIDNLDFTKPLYTVEGIPSVASIWSSIDKNVSAIFGVSITEAQIKILEKFPEVIHIPDNDLAGYLYIKRLNKTRVNLQVIDILYEDTDDEYIEAIKTTKKISAGIYLLRHFKEYELKDKIR